ncbi:MAG: hypothetical protein ACXWQE_15010 [Bdellovibrionales bacterium]
MKTISLSLTAAFLFLGCASTGPKGGLPSAVAIEFKGKPGEVTKTHYYSNAHILSYQDGQILRDRTEGVDFTVDTHVTEFDPAKKILKYEVRTTEKDGAVELHDLAFPELNEQLYYTVRTNGEVLNVNNLRSKSLFYVPALPTPKAPVQIGDTWTMEHDWVSSKDGIPMQLEVVAILKDIVACEKKNVCADIELSGHVEVMSAPKVVGARFNSRLWGRVLFSLERGDVIWSEMRSTEEMAATGDRMAVRSCMVSEMKLGGKPKIEFACNPTDDAVTKTPVY